jgi:hypothetical protein
MDLASLLILLAILVPVVAYLVFPLIEGQEERLSGDERRLSLLQDERERLLSAIAELDMDYSMGKLEPQDYEAERAAKMARGADVLRRIDVLHGGAEAISAQSSPIVADLETRIAELRKHGDPQTRNLCPTCGHEISADDRFCSRCGSPIESQESVE